MRLTYIFSIIIFVSACATESVKTEKTPKKVTKSDAQRLGLEGQVKSFAESTFQAVEKDGEIVKGTSALDKREKFNTETTFNQAGNKLEVLYLDAEGKMQRREVFRYNQDQNIVEYNRFNSENINRGKYNNEFDSKGNRTKETTYNQKGEIKEIKTFQYDENNNLTERIRQRPNGQIFKKYAYQYDKNNNKVESIIHNGNGVVTQKIVTSYDELNNRKEEFIYSTENVLKEKITYKYKGKNRMEKTIFNSKGAVVEKWSGNYDANDNLIETNSFHKYRKKIKKWTGKYDSNNNLIEYFTYEENGSQKDKYNNQYEIDDHGNWIKKIEFINDRPKTIVIRKITYHN